MNGTAGAILIPGDLIEPIDLFTDTTTFRLVTVGGFQRHRPDPRDPVYTALGQEYRLHPRPAPGTEIHLHYYGQQALPAVDTDENGWLQSAYEALLYTAAWMAADYYQIGIGDGVNWRDQWVSLASAEIAKLEEQDRSEEWAGDMSIETDFPNIC